MLELLMRVKWRFGFGVSHKVVGLLPLLAVGAMAQEPVLQNIEGHPVDLRVLRRAGGDLLVVADRDGHVRTLSAEGESARPSLKPRGSLQVADPGSALLDLGEVLGDGGTPELLVLGSDGLHAHRLGEDGTFVPEGIRLDSRRASRSARLGLRTRVPRFAPLLRDFDDDGRAEVFVPGFEGVRLFSGKDGPQGPRFGEVARFEVPERTRRSYRGERLSDRWSSSVQIGSLVPRDWNGDGRQDLRIENELKHAFYLRREDGTFPETPDTVLDLQAFTGPEARSEGVAPGKVLAGEGRRRLVVANLDDDGIPDAVIAHRRRIWVFRGDPKGPRFEEPVQVLSTAEDVSQFLLLPLDEDDRPDLVILKVVVPSVGQILAGAVSGLEVDVTVLGYRGEEGARFATSPTWRSRIVLDLPALGTLLSDVDDLIARVERIDEKITGFEEGDLDGNGKPDLVQARRDRLRLWWDAAPKGARPGSAVLRELLVGAKERRENLDGLTNWLEKLADGARIERTGDRGPDLEVSLPVAEQAVLRQVLLADLDGDGRDALHLVWERPHPHAGLAITTRELSR